MTIALLEITDQSLALICDGELLAFEPCYATFHDNWVFGEQARSMQRLKPQESQANHFAHLSTESLPRPMGNLRHRADLAYLQIKALHHQHQHQYSRLFVIAPPQYDITQLSLLLGLIETAGLPIAGFIEAGLLESRTHVKPDRDLLYIDVGRHQVTARTYREGIDSSVTLQARQTLADRGLSQMVEGLMQEVQHTLINADRFDPMRRAETEQQLFEGVLSWFEEGNQQTEEVTLMHEDRLRRVAITDAMLRVATGRMLSQVTEAVRGANTDIVINHRLHQIPGVIEQLRLGTQFKIEALTRTELIEAFTLSIGALDGENQDPGQRITSLRDSKASNPVHHGPIEDPSPVLATHLLENGIAVPINPASASWPAHWSELRFVEEPKGLALAPAQGLWVNEHPLNAPTGLQAGDEIRVGSLFISAICVNH